MQDDTGRVIAAQLKEIKEAIRELSKVLAQIRDEMSFQRRRSS